MHGESTQQKVSAVPSLGNLQISKSKLTWKANHSISPSYKRQTGDSKDLEISNCKPLLVRKTLFQPPPKKKMLLTKLPGTLDWYVNYYNTQSTEHYH